MADHTSSASSSPLSLRLRFVVVALVLFQGVLSWTAALHKSMTCDEIAHLTGGISIWHGDYRMVPENGNFPQRLYALPAALAGIEPSLVKSFEQLGPDVWSTGSKTFFKTPGIDHWPWLMAGRALATLFLMGVGVMVFFWARRWWGDAAGLTALAASVLCPNLLAHGSLINTDIAASLFLPLSAGLYWWHLHRFDWKSRIAIIAALGLACVTKYSAGLLIPTIIILVTIHLIVRRKQLRLAVLGRLVADHAAIVVSIILIIWTFHGWHFRGTHDPDTERTLFSRPWSWALGDPGKLRALVLNSLYDLRILPESYIYGAGYTAASSEMRLSFLNGQTGIYGWFSFFPYAFAVKTPLPLFALCGLGVLAIFKRWRDDVKNTASYALIKSGLYRAAPLLVWSVIYTTAALTTHLNIGHRHLLPLYPGLYILAGAAITLRLRIAQVATSLALACLAFISFQIRPHYLSYFNPLAGGPENGWKHLVDSSLDWGQDLPALKSWITENQGNENLYLSFFGTSHPGYYGIKPIYLISTPRLSEDPYWNKLHGGYYAFSATMLQLIFPGPWTREKDLEYQSLRQQVLLVEDHVVPYDPKKPFDLIRLEQLRTTRLAHVLRERTPLAMPGYSILIYHLTEEEAVAIDHGELPRQPFSVP